MTHTQVAPPQPLHVDGDPTWQALQRGEVVSNQAVRQLLHSIELAGYTAYSADQAKVYRALAKELQLANQLVNTPINAQGEFVVDGVTMTRSQASQYYNDAFDALINQNQVLQPRPWLDRHN